MPFVKSAEGKVAIALEPEVKSLLDKGFTLLNDVEEAAHREALALDIDLTSFYSQEKARLEAGIYKAIYPTDGAVGENAVSVPQNIPAAGSGGVDASAAQNATPPATSQPSTPGDSQPLSNGGNANPPSADGSAQSGVAEASGPVNVTTPVAPASEPETPETNDGDADDAAAPAATNVAAQDSTNAA